MSDHYAEQASRILREAGAGTGDDGPVRLPADRVRMVLTVQRGLRARRRRKQVTRWAVAGGGMAAAAAAALLLVGGRGWRRDAGDAQVAVVAPRAAAPALTVLSAGAAQGGAQGVMVGGGAAPVPLAEGMALRRGFRLFAPADGEVRIGAARGTTLTLEQGGDLRVDDDGPMQRYELRGGAVRAQVSKLVAGERFIVATADAEIEVHGTAFRVAVVPGDPACGDGTTTRLTVTEGVVSVRSGGVETRVVPGGVWPERCGTAAASPALPAGPASVGRPAARAHAAPAASARAGLTHAALHETPPPAPDVAPAAPAAQEEAEPSSPAARRRASLLAAQNDLFSSAVHAGRRKQTAEALRLFERLLREYPDSPLAESAAAHRMNLLRVGDPWAAGVAAREYLARFPNGFARQEAERIAAGADQ
jgi:hypothetical protein